MATLQLRVDLTDSGQAHALRYQLDGLHYRFLFKYNGITDLWYLDLSDDAGEVLVAGIGIAVSEGQGEDEILDLLKPHRHLEVPPGLLYAFDTSGDHVESGLEDMDTRVVLLYEEAA